MSILRKAQQQIAHTSTLPALGNRDLRQLQDVISTEKDFVKSNARSATDFQKSAEALKAWGEGEGEDLGDVLSKLSLLLTHYTSAQTRLNSHLSTTRLHYKSVRTREEALAALRTSRSRLASRIETLEKELAKMGPENKRLLKTTTDLRERRSEMETMSRDLREEEAAIGDFKRRTVREAAGLKCGALLEFSEKVQIIAEISKLMIEEIPLEATEPGMPRAAYGGAAKTDQLLSEATRCLADVGFSPTGDTAQRNYNTMSSAAPAGTGADEDPSYDQAGDMYMPPARASADASTPIYATHATGAAAAATPWASTEPAGQQHNAREASAFDGAGIPDPAAREWGNDRVQTPVGERVGRWQSSTEASVLPNEPGNADHSSANAYGGMDADNGYGITAPSAAPVDAAPTLGVHNAESNYYASAPVIPAPAPVAPIAAAAAAPPTNEAHSAGQDYSAIPTLPPLRTSSPLPSSGASRTGTYEAPEASKKISAAAFRRGFGARTPSAQHMGTGAQAGPSTDTYGAPGGMLASPIAGGGEEDSTAPLSIRKRLSGINVSADGSSEPPPVYAQAPGTEAGASGAYSAAPAPGAHQAPYSTYS